MSLPTVNKRWIVPTANCGTDKLFIEEVPMHTINDDEIIIEVRALSLNYRDVLITMSPYYPTDANIVPISDGAGVVVATGKNVTRVQIGDRVAGIFSPGYYSGKDTSANIGVRPSLGSQHHGFAQQYVKLSGEDVVKIPEYLSYEEAASLPCAAVTAWAGLHLNYGVHEGRTVLVQGTGGVSVFAAQLAKASGARVIATSSSDDKLQRLVDLGVLESVQADGVNYKTTPDWDQGVLEKTSGLGADIIIEVGGAGSIGKSVKAAAKNGEIACIGLLDQGEPQTIDYMALFLKALQVRGVHIGHREEFEQLLAFMTEKRIHPVIDEKASAKYCFFNLNKAIADMAHGGHFGKIVISIDADNKGKKACC